MKYRRFGRTEIPMPIFSCGGMRYIYDEFKEYPKEQIPLDNQQNLELIDKNSDFIKNERRQGKQI